MPRERFDENLTDTEVRAVGCPKCHAKPGEPCYKRWGREASWYHSHREMRAAVEVRIYNIGFCPKHGLHGQRTRCFACERLLEQIPMRATRDTEQEHSAEPDTREAVSADDLRDAIG